MSKHIVFISYNIADTAFAHKIANDLRRAEIDVWLAPKELRVGDVLTDEITKAIKRCDYLAVILSPSSMKSAWVEKEMKIMKNEKGAEFILPLLYGKCALPSIFPNDILYPDFTDEKNYVFMLRLLLNRINPSFNRAVYISAIELQEIIDKLPVPPRRPITENRTLMEEIKFVSENSVDLGQLESLMHWETRKFYSALRELIKTRKIEMFLLKSISDGSHPAIPAGKTMILPMIFKGLLPPGVRSSEEEIERILSNMERE